MHFIIELKRDANPNVVLNNLTNSRRWKTFGAILIALVDKEPKVLTLHEMIDHYIALEEDVIQKEQDLT